MGKKIFIAVGSTATDSLMVLIKSCMRENIFHEKKDVFVGIDSDKSRIDRLERLHGDRARVQGVLLRAPTDLDAPSLAREFRPEWTDVDVIPDVGVGGLRRKSFIARPWCDPDFERCISNIGTEDEVYLLGTAFGGTATGVFWNIACAIRDRWPMGMVKRQETTSKFAAIIILPMAPRDHNYPVAKNLCEFMKDMQLYAWVEQLTDYGRNDERSGIRCPSFALTTDAQRVSVWRPAKSPSPYSHLPVDFCLFVPTPEVAEQATVAAAEAAFVMSYLGLYGQYMPELINQTTQVSKELVFGGLTMVSARNPRNAALSRRFYSLLRNEYIRFTENTASPSKQQAEWLDKTMTDAIEGNQKTVEDIKVAVERVKTRLAGRSLREMEEEMPGVLADLAKTVCNYPYEWIDFAKWLDIIRHTQSGDVDRRVSLDVLCSAYNAKLESIRKDAGSKKDQSISGINNAKILITTAVRKARAIAEFRRKSRFVRLMDCGGIMETEVKEATTRALATLMSRYVSACRAEASLDRLTSAPRPQDEKNGKRKKRYEFILQLLEKRTLSGSEARPAFIYESDEDVGGDGLNKLFVDEKNLSAIILDTLVAEDDPSCIEVLDKAERDGTDDLKRTAKKLEANNPLKAIETKLLDPDPKKRVRAFAQQFAIEEAKAWCPCFYFRCGEAEALTWKQIESDLGFRAFGSLGVTNKDGNFKPDEAKPKNAKVFLHNVTDADEDDDNIRGLWLGTLNADQLPQQYVRAVYIGSPVNEWQSKAAQETALGDTPSRLMRLKTALFLGCVLGAIERKLNASRGNKVTEAWNVSVKIEKSAEHLIELPRFTVSQLFEAIENTSNLFLRVVPRVWIRPLMEWVEGSFMKDMGVPETADGLGGELSFEDSILTKMSLTVKPDIKAKIDDLMCKLEKRVTITSETA